MFAGKKSAQIREILISESAWEEMTCLFAPSLALWAITASAIKYHGLLLWKILALLAVVGNCFDYLDLVFTLIF
ncbi:hypothetical protein ACHHZA_15895 [Citrobacter freundii complex sp. 2024EL-00230]|uniref:hypothetical protein n=1 Tax=Citrobacter freundii complex sp. 2024EL-00230 TaxID=3374265 RepID=UPI003751F0C8